MVIGLKIRWYIKLVYSLKRFVGEKGKKTIAWITYNVGWHVNEAILEHRLSLLQSRRVTGGLKALWLYIQPLSGCKYYIY